MAFDYYTLEILLKRFLNFSFLASRTNVLIKQRSVDHNLSLPNTQDLKNISWAKERS